MMYTYVIIIHSAFPLLSAVVRTLVTFLQFTVEPIRLLLFAYIYQSPDIWSSGESNARETHIKADISKFGIVAPVNDKGGDKY